MSKATQPKRVIFDAQNLDLHGHVLGRISAEIDKLGNHAADTHIKNNCDLHGKGNHIKGAGPNYLKSSSSLSKWDNVSNPQIFDLIKNAGTYENLIEVIAKQGLISRITKDVTKIKGI